MVGENFLIGKEYSINDIHKIKGETYIPSDYCYNSYCINSHGIGKKNFYLKKLKEANINI